MGKDVSWGTMEYSRGVIKYGISPYEQRPFRAMLPRGIFNFLRGFRAKLFPVGIPILFFTTLFSWAFAENERQQKKAFLHPEFVDEGEDEC